MRKNRIRFAETTGQRSVLRARAKCCTTESRSEKMVSANAATYVRQDRELLTETGVDSKVRGAKASQSSFAPSCEFVREALLRCCGASHRIRSLPRAVRRGNLASERPEA